MFKFEQLTYFRSKRCITTEKEKDEEQVSCGRTNSSTVNLP